MIESQNIVFGIYFTAFIVGLPAFDRHYNSSCGKDKSPVAVIYEGPAKIETYPWLGYLVYRSAKSLHSTTVVLVTKQIVIGTASEINLIPKHDFRARARVFVGHNCSGPSIPVRDYTYHPDYIKKTHSALALIQLDLDYVRQELTPICPPPPYFIDSVFYAMTMTPDCKKPVVQIYQMEHVDPVQCKIFYRKSGLNLKALWPTHTACGKASHGGDCLWRGGTVLVLKQAGRWRLVGFGIYGPGCEAPARFLDYGMYHDWIRTSVQRTGRPSISRIGPNVVILRRSLSNVQRYGPCDPEEIKEELYTDETSVDPEKISRMRVRYNMTVYANVEYSCVVFRAKNHNPDGEPPRVRLRRWCAGSPRACSGLQYIEIDFYVEVIFSGRMTFSMKAYGRKAVGIDVKLAMKYINSMLAYPKIWTGGQVREALRNMWVEWSDIKMITTTTTTTTTKPTSTITTEATTDSYDEDLNMPVSTDPSSPVENDQSFLPNEPSSSVDTYQSDLLNEPSSSVDTYQNDFPNEPPSSVDIYQSDLPNEPSSSVETYQSEFPNEPPSSVDTYQSDLPKKPSSSIEND